MYCKTDLETYKKMGYKIDDGCCPVCYRMYMTPRKIFYRCPKCKTKAEMYDFLPGSLYGVEGVICPMCTISGCTPVICEEVPKND